MTKKFDHFMECLESLCRQHDVEILCSSPICVSYLRSNDKESPFGFDTRFIDGMDLAPDANEDIGK